MGRCNGLRYVNRLKVVSQCSTAALELRDDSLITRTTRAECGKATHVSRAETCMFNHDVQCTVLPNLKTVLLHQKEVKAEEGKTARAASRPRTQKSRGTHSQMKLDECT